MNRRRFTRVWIGVAVVLAAALVVVHYVRPQGTAPPSFTDLDTALAPEKAHGWAVTVPPRREGPYRRLPGGPVLARDPADGLVCRLTDEKGVVVEEIKLQGIEGCDQAVVYLETADGKKTMAALKRARGRPSP
jgi:hypothetical protein